MVTRSQVDSAGEDSAAFHSAKSEKAEDRSLNIDPPLSERARIDVKVASASQEVIEAAERENAKRMMMMQLAQMFGGGQAMPGAPPVGPAGPGPQGGPGALVGLLKGLNNPIGARLV